MTCSDPMSTADWIGAGCGVMLIVAALARILWLTRSER